MSAAAAEWVSVIGLIVFAMIGGISLSLFMVRRWISHGFERLSRRMDRQLDRLSRETDVEVPHGVAAKIYYLGKTAGKREVAG